MSMYNIQINLLRFLRYHRHSSIYVNVKQGKICGQSAQLPNGNYYYSFKGIPYAVPPIGKFRFQKPQPLDRFQDEILDCRKNGKIALQKNRITEQITGSEDCLNLNVYTPKLQENTNGNLLPVMVWIHGGAFLTGNGNKFHPIYFLEENVIVVTMNYRLGILGFLSLPDENIPGNNGLKDQLQVLKWVKENIENFHGNPQNITLFGHSAGAASIHFHLISENSKKYFHKAILQSGTANMHWALEPTQQISQIKAIQLAKFLGYSAKSSNNQKSLDFLQNINANLLIEHQLQVLTIEDLRSTLPIPFKPVIEDNQNNAIDAIITKLPINYLKSSTQQIQVPIILGITSQEAIMILMNNYKKLNLIDDDLERFIPKNLLKLLSLKEIKEIVKNIREFYMQNQYFTYNYDENYMKNICNLFSDYYFNMAIQQTIELHTKYQSSSESAVYFYEFAYCGGRNMYKKWSKLDSLKGACHGDELFYLFEILPTTMEIEVEESEREYNTRTDEKIQKEICKMWTNFAKFNIPTPSIGSGTVKGIESINDSAVLPFQWNPVQYSNDSGEYNFEYLEINENSRMKQNLNKERMDFWRQIYDQHT